ncbi:hypothetical protein M0R72_01850 [Candidatus Pacearchaeota archaeon]|jgi:hypothetical protein|nr:hypothetical protein [Candidatus Pacearchaeota archaeon]
MARKTKKKFFIKEVEGIHTVTEEFFSDIESRDEALVLAIRALDEIHTTLKEEVGGDSMVIGTMKVTTGLQRSLEELDKRWPSLLEQMYSTPRNIDGHKITFN